MVRAIIKYTFKAFAKLFYFVKVNGKENMPLERCCNNVC